MLRWLTDKLRRGGRRPLRERLSLRSIMTWINVVSILAAGLVAGYYALTILYQNKLNDTWAIMYLELETQGRKLAETLVAASTSSKPLVEADSVLVLQPGGKLVVEQGGFGGRLSLADFNIEDDGLPEDLAPVYLVSYAGESYLLKAAGQSESGAQRLVLRRLPASVLEIRPAPKVSQGALYLLTREGSLAYSSDPGITELNVVKRPLVQRFIETPIKQGQFELDEGAGKGMYGFFAEIPGTNIVMFSEMSRAAALAPVRTIVVRFIGVLLLILGGAVVLLQLPLSRVTNPLRELADLAEDVGRGNFDIKPSQNGLGELATLTSAFSSMATGLVQRDQRLEVLMRENVEKVRLEGELAIARSIQENLLPATKIPKESGLAIAAEYVSAAECAGDWYQYAFDPETRETVIVIVDVSGHGAGASMFTSMIAGLFEYFRSQSSGTFQTAEFTRHVNDLIYKLGRKKWHATMAVVRFMAKDAEVEIMVAGHPAPLVRRREGSDMQMVKLPYLATSFLGGEPGFEPVCHRIPFPQGSSLLLYTDGLIEAANGKGKAFSRKRARDSFLAAPLEAGDTLSTLLTDWRSHLAGQAPQDDVCIVAVRAA